MAANAAMRAAEWNVRDIGVLLGATIVVEAR